MLLAERQRIRRIALPMQDGATSDSSSRQWQSTDLMRIAKATFAGTIPGHEHFASERNMSDPIALRLDYFTELVHFQPRFQWRDLQQISFQRQKNRIQEHAAKTIDTVLLTLQIAPGSAI